jgi:hypothetical protein
MRAMIFAVCPSICLSVYLREFIFGFVAQRLKRMFDISLTSNRGRRESRAHRLRRCLAPQTAGTAARSVQKRQATMAGGTRTKRPGRKIYSQQSRHSAHARPKLRVGLHITDTTSDAQEGWRKVGGVPAGTAQTPRRSALLSGVM